MGAGGAVNTLKQDKLWSVTTLKSINVARAQRPDLPDRFRFHTSALTSITLDHKALRATYDMTEIVAEDCRKFEPPPAESDWFHLARGMANALSVHERRAMGEIDKEANQEVKAYGLRGSVLT